MISYILVKYLHYVGIIVLSAGLVSEFVLFSRTLSENTISQLVKADKLYVFGAVIMLITGLMLIFWVGKSSSFYASNRLFYIKFSLFLLIGLLSIKPTLFINRMKKEKGEYKEVPSSIIKSIYTQMLLLILIPFLAIVMSFNY